MTNHAQPSTHSTQNIARSSAYGRGGAVAGKMDAAVQVGTRMLADGGNAIDAAVATAFAMGVVEPWMNGIGGGGFMVGWLAEERRPFTISYPMISGSTAHERMFPLAHGVDSALFGWPSVQGNANSAGYASIAVPGTVAGLALALERYGTRSFAEVIAPAIELAETGFPVTWHTTLMTAKDLTNLRRFPATAAIFLNGDVPPVTLAAAQPAIIRNPELARTLRTIADQGAQAFYEGELGAGIAAHLAENGAAVTAEDFANYRARELDPLTFEFQGSTIATIAGASGGPSLRESMGILDHLAIGDFDHNSPESLHRLGYAFRTAFADRFTWLADEESVEVPFERLLADDYLANRAAGFDPERAATPAPGTREELGVRHQLQASVPEYMRDGSTTHLGVIDAQGNAVSLTQTLLGLWGSRVTVPGTGVLMNNGMMWFDPEPGRPNSVGPNKRPLSNMAPLVMARNGEATASIGSSGGRKIMNCNVQIAINLGMHEMTMGDALAAPRIDASTSDLLLSARIHADTVAAMHRLGYRTGVVDETQLLGSFASPCAINRSTDGNLEAAADAWYFPASARTL